MEYRTVQFEVVETTNPYGWKWVVFRMLLELGLGSGLPALTPCRMLNLLSTRHWTADRANLRKTARRDPKQNETFHSDGGRVTAQQTVIGRVATMDFRRHDIRNVHRLFRAVLELRRQVTSLEKAESGKLHDTRSGMNYSPLPRTNLDGRSARKAGFTRKARKVPYTAQRIPRGSDR